MSRISIRNAIYDEIDSLYQQCVDIQVLWMKKIAKRELQRSQKKTSVKEMTNYELRIEFTDCAFTARWLRVQFITRGKNTFRVVDAVTIPKTNIHNMSQFKYAKEWELEIIKQIEEPLSSIRKQVKNLMNAHRAVIYADKADMFAQEKLTKIKMADRVEVRKNTIKQFKERERMMAQ